MRFVDNNEIVRRLKKYPVLTCFPESVLSDLVTRSEIMELVSDQILFYRNDPSDSVYYVIEGHLEGFSSDSFQRKIVDIHRGEMIGEMGVVSGESRGLAVKASCDSCVLKIGKDVFLSFFQKNPELLMVLTQTMAKRLRHVIMDLQDTHYPYRSIGLIALSSEISLEKIKKVFQLYTVADHVNPYEKSDFDALNMDMLPFFHQCEDYLGINIFFVSYGEEHWRQAVLEHADYVYLITLEGGWEKLDVDILARLKKRPADIVIMHHACGVYSDTAQFYSRHPFKRHHHLTDTKADYQRLYRYMTGQAIGLVISGGGFRGYAHYGLVKALFEAKIPIDCIGGSSMGAIVGALLALKFDWTFFDEMFNQQMKELKKIRIIKHVTLPFLSVLSGEVITNILKNVFSTYQIEDLALNFFCVVSNLSKSQKDIRMKGKLWEWLRASVAIPGLLPPYEKEGCIYVDGGVCTNLPVLDMREYLDKVGKIITFDIRIPPFHREDYKFPPILTFKDMLFYKLGFAKYQYVLPNLMDVVMESSFINQYIYDTQGAKKADIMIAPDTSAFNGYDKKKSESLVLFAYDLAKEKFAESKAIYERWII